MRKRLGVLAIVLSLVMSAVGCKVESSDKSESDTMQSNEVNQEQCRLDVLQPLAYGNVNGLNLEPGTYISIIGRGKSSAYWREVKRGAGQAVDDINAMLGYKGEDKVKLTYLAPDTENNVDGQVNILDEELARYPDALGIAAVDASACEVQFDLAIENNIPIVTFDSGTNYQNIVSMIDTNNIEASTMAANKMCADMGESGEILLLVHDSKSTSGKEREQGFVKEVSEKHPNIKIAHSYHLDELKEMQKLIASEQAAAEEQKEKMAETSLDISQEEVVQYILEKNPNITGIYATSEACAKLAVNVLETMEKEEISVISFDGGKEQLELLEEGKISGLMIQNPYGMGYATVVACARAILEQGNEAKVDTGYVWVTKENMKEESIENMLY